MASDLYDYSKLSEASKKKAIEELNENPDQINAHIESFRRWLKSMPHIKCPLDSQFLVKFLRTSKYDHNKAQKRIDNFCTVRSSPRGSPEFFKFYEVDHPTFQSFLKMKMHLPLGKCDSGEEILLVKPKAWDVDILPIVDLAKCIFMDIDMIVGREDVQINGIKILIDLDGISNPKFSKKWHQVMQDSYPMRMKGQIFYREPTIFDIIFQIISFFQSEKTKSRTFRVKDDIRKAMDKVPGLERILPLEYGGKGGTIDSIFEKLYQDVKEYFKNGDPLASIAVDESKRPKDTLKNLTDYGEYKGPTLGTSGTYTKFDNVY